MLKNSIFVCEMFLKYYKHDYKKIFKNVKLHKNSQIRVTFK
jgi:hypothetical protein